MKKSTIIQSNDNIINNNIKNNNNNNDIQDNNNYNKNNYIDNVNDDNFINEPSLYLSPSVSSTTATISLSTATSPSLISSSSFILQQQQNYELPLIRDKLEYCKFWNSSEFKDGYEYSCNSKTLTKIPQKLLSVYSLTISSAGIVQLRSTALRKYGDTLRDITLTDLPQFECIQAGSFESIKNLRTIYVSSAPKLTNLSNEVFTGISSSIKTIRIINSGLVRIPSFKSLQSHDTILTMVDLAGNCINNVESNSVQIKTELLSLDSNAIRNIEDSAFYGSQIAKLTFIGNRQLSTIHPSAFAGIMNLRELDLSSTSIVRLPSIGLNELEILKVQNTHTLKTIPSIYNFKNLQIAWLTHSFHCCAFKFPSRHDPLRHAKRLKYLEHLEKTCSGNVEDNGELLDSSESFELGQIEEISRQQMIQQKLLLSSTSTSSSVPLKSSLEKKGIRYSTSKDGIVLRRTKRMIAEKIIRMYRGTVLNPWDNLNGSQFSKDTELLSEDPLRGSPINLDFNVDEDIVPEDEEFLNMEDIGEFHIPLYNVTTQNTHFDALCGNVTFKQREVACFPVPDALNPCEDVMGSNWLRAPVWVVVLLAVFGNFAVLVVIMATRNDGSVPKFLMSHLAFADLCMGLYLLLLASIDAHSMGEYFNYAFDWQYGPGCQIAGSLTVFASHLSVFTLTIITIERWFAITQAMYLNKRIKLRPAKYIMAFGWMYSFLMSALPLFGISNYSSTSICLPMEVRDHADVAYLVSILGINGAAFFIIAICYTQIYFSLGTDTRRSRNQSIGEMTVAKKMALLVFTNFSCWAPIAFFGLTAIAGYPLINVTKSKILLVFFYPLNSCADPYLYALLTAQYRKDLYALLSKFGICKQKALKYKASLTMPATNLTTHQIGTTTGSPTQMQEEHNTILESNHSNHSNHSMLCSKQDKIPEAVAMLDNTDFV
ncbi:lutropin-choriogonadotropic hormone receptor [Condylostylus longicornis]|uniref:lutropin-choriogonadotropic hormone receptor n=1 Tax=Condylostylus longicornis TaxID=2530218 RepID=UPI00244DFF7A|nr:lutropin-choriogonadotropic hormone receptor [Condylostylus longicornis]